ncbi:MAG: acyltransferase [Schwartzia sp.]|nr:acyltransferase [Schwartzia sp. (in: firmicutes)]
MTVESPQKKLRPLQGLRGFACLAVVLSHYPFLRHSDGSNAMGELGGLGVEVFILLSGYLLCYWHWQDESATGSLRENLSYAVHKMGKYYWLHLATLICALPFWIVPMLSRPSWGKAVSLPANLLLIQTFFPWSGVYFGLNGVSWYLSITLFFLFMSRWVLRFLKRLAVRQTALLMLGIIVGEALWAIGVEQLGVPKGVSHWLAYVFPCVRILDFVLGGGTYVLARAVCPQFSKTKQRLALLLVMIAYAVMIWVCSSEPQNVLWHDNQELASVSIWAMPSVLLMLLLGCQALRGEAGGVFENPFLVFIGNISLELFLVHQLFKRYASAAYQKFAVPCDERILLAAALLLSVLAAWQIHRRFPAGIPLSEGYERLRCKFLRKS